MSTGVGHHADTAAAANQNAGAKCEGMESSVDAERCTWARGFVLITLVRRGTVEPTTRGTVGASRGGWVAAEVSSDRQGCAVTRRCL
jgi:hypothetical protein